MLAFIIMLYESFSKKMDAPEDVASLKHRLLFLLSQIVIDWVM